MRPSPLSPAAAPIPGSHHGIPRRTLGVVVLVAAAGTLAGCGIRVGKGSPASLPDQSAEEAARDALARRAVLIGSTAQVRPEAGGKDSEAASAIVDIASAQVTGLGGVWEPWATAVPTDYPTATPVATAATTAAAEDLVTVLTEGVAQARTAVLSAGSAAVGLYGALAASWTACLSLLGTEVEGTPRDATEMTEPVSDALLLAYDAARYAMESVGARAEGMARTRAVADAAVARATVDRSLELGSKDDRLSAYAEPTAQDGASADATWAREVWLDVCENEIAGLSTLTGDARGTAVDAACDAVLRARAWGADAPALPGYSA